MDLLKSFVALLATVNPIGAAPFVLANSGTLLISALPLRNAEPAASPSVRG